MSAAIDAMERARLKPGKVRNPLVTLNEKTREAIMIDAEMGSKYPVDLDRCDTPEELLNWIQHLCRKCWVTRRHINELISVVAKEKGWVIPDA